MDAAPPGALDVVDGALNRVYKKQRTVAAATADVLDTLITAFEEAKRALAAGQETVPAALEQLQHAVRSCQEACSQSYKDYLTEVAGLGRAIDVTFQEPQLYQAKGWTAEPAICDQIIADHLYRVGSFDIAEIYEQETELRVSPTLQQPFREIYELLERMKAKELAPALAWCETYSRVPDLSSGQASRLQELTFQLHRLRVIRLLEAGDKLEAVRYAQQNLLTFYDKNLQHAREVRRLLCAVLWAGRLPDSPYKCLLSDQLWADAAYLLTTVACSALGLPKDSNLAVCVAAGYLALPTLAKYAQLRPRFRGAPCDVQMPDFGPELQFHSTFACPVIQQVSTPTNPPMLLPCQHVLSQSAVNSLMKAGGRLKCPYCPTDCQRDQCLVLHLYNTAAPSPPVAS